MADVEYEYEDERSISADLKCSICHNIFNDPYRTLCSHYYCRECIRNWLAEHNTCPLCKRQPTILTDLVKAETSMTNKLNRLSVICKKCGTTNIRRDQIRDHIENQCPGIRLYRSRTKRDHSVDEHYDDDLGRPVMDPSGSLIRQLIEQNKKFSEEFQRQKALINKNTDQINTLKEGSHLQSNSKHQTKIEQLERIIQTQKEQLQEQEISINQLQIDNQRLQNQINHQNDDLTEHEDQICSLWTKINRKLNSQINHPGPTVQG
jgi:chromosome segregation ATPase